jgi:hypothetical protein
MAAEVSKRAQFLAELTGEVLAILLGLWMVFGLGWEEFGPGLVLFGSIGFVVTAVRMWKGRGQPVEDDESSHGAEDSFGDGAPPTSFGPIG